NARAGQAFLPQQGNGLVEFAACVFEIGSRAAHLGDEALEHVCDGVACPGIRHRDPNTVDMRQSEGTWSALMVMSITGQDGQYLARAQSNADVDHPDEAVRKGRLAQGQ